jgi:hypothetical protein
LITEACHRFAQAVSGRSVSPRIDFLSGPQFFERFSHIRSLGRDFKGALEGISRHIIQISRKTSLA